MVCRLADHIDSVFGPGENQLHGYPGHPEIELALMRLYDVTQEPRYLNLVKYFIEERGAQPHFYDIEYEKRGRTSYWNTYGPAWMVRTKPTVRRISRLPNNKRPSATPCVLSI